MHMSGKPVQHRTCDKDMAAGMRINIASLPLLTQPHPVSFDIKFQGEDLG